MKTVTVQNQTWWDNLPIDAVFDDFYQQNRVVIPNCHGTDVYFHFTERHFQKRKSGAQTWQLILAP